MGKNWGAAAVNKKKHIKKIRRHFVGILLSVHLNRIVMKGSGR